MRLFTVKKLLLLGGVMLLLIVTGTYLNRQNAPTQVSQIEKAITSVPTNLNIASNTALSSLAYSNPTLKLPLKTRAAQNHLIISVENKKEARDENEEDENAERKTEADRWAAEFKMIKDPKTGQIPRGIHAQEINAAKKVNKLQLPAETSSTGLNTRTLPVITTTVRGPNNYGGRTRAIAFDKRNTQIVLAGGVSGGVFRSTDGGGTWTRVAPAGDIHNLTAIAQDPSAPDTWYYGTGENSGNSASGTGGTYLCSGIWKSTDNGVTWTALAKMQSNLYAFDIAFGYISRLIRLTAII